MGVELWRKKGRLRVCLSSIWRGPGDWKRKEREEGQDRGGSELIGVCSHGIFFNLMLRCRFFVFFCLFRNLSTLVLSIDLSRVFSIGFMLAMMMSLQILCGIMLS